MDELADSRVMGGGGEPIPTTEKSMAFFTCSMVLPVRFVKCTYLACCAVCALDAWDFLA
jgi:hypothetical protein